MSRIIAIDASPNLTKEDLKISLGLLFKPWKWKNSENLKKLEEYFNKNYNPKKIQITQSGRVALYKVLSSFIKKNDEVILQAFTCLVVPNAINGAGGKPIFADISAENYNIDPESLKNKITEKTKAVIVQHTFGIPADLKTIRDICREKNIFLIEDCAHSLGAKYDGKFIGSFGDAAIFSFNQDKVVSGINGGVLIINQAKMSKKFNLIPEEIISYSRIFKNLLHPLLWSVVLPLYNFLNLGKIILFFAWKAKILSNTLTPNEIEGGIPKESNLTMSGPQAKIALNGVSRLERDNRKRKEIAQKYKKELNISEVSHPVFDDSSDSIFLRYPIQVKDPEKLILFARKKGIILGKWYNSPVFPWVEASKQYYNFGDCPVAEEVGKKIVNLPTIPNLKEKDIERIIKVIKEFYGNN